MARIGVVHLVWCPLGPERLAAFVASYQGRAAGTDHDLIVIFNGARDAADLAAHRRVLEGAALAYTPLVPPRPLLDIAAYFAATDAFPDHAFLCFVNSYSALGADDWLAKLLRPLAGDAAVGLAGATGSWESIYTVYRAEWRTQGSVPKRLLAPLRIALYRRAFPPFPNPHVRTNGFAIRRDVFASLKRPRLRRKLDALRFENGANGLTRQIVERGLRPVLVGGNGDLYEQTDWPASGTYRQGEQENLLITDNRTAVYARADEPTRARLSRAAWGTPAR